MRPWFALLCSVLSTIALLAFVQPALSQVQVAGYQNTCADSTLAEGFVAPNTHYTAKYQTLAHAMLAEEQAVATVTPEMLSILDSLLDEAASRLQPLPVGLSSEQARNFAENSLRQMDCILLRHGFVYPGHGAVQLLREGLIARNFTEFKALNEVYRQPHNSRRRAFIQARRFGPFYIADCDLAAFLFVAMGEVLGYPIQLVDIPNHIFVSWRFADGSYVNYETMDGLVTDDAYYQRNWQIPRDFMNQGGILQAMSTIEAKAYHTAAVAEALSWQQDYKPALAAYERSIEQDGRRPFALHQLAMFYLADPLGIEDSSAQALQYARLAAKVFPSGDNLDTLACAYAKANDFKQALKTSRQAESVTYAPFESDIAGHRQAFMRCKVCATADFGRDLTPFY